MYALYLFFLLFCQVSCQKYPNYTEEFGRVCSRFPSFIVLHCDEEEQNKNKKNASETHDDDILRQ